MRVVGSMLMLAVFAIACVQGIGGQTPVQGCPLQEYKIVSDFSQIKAGEIASFEIQSKGEEKVEGDFTWSVSTGTIIAGQGTSYIKVQTRADVLNPKPAEPESTLGEPSFIWFSRPRVSLKITAILAHATDCPDERLSTSITIGRLSAVPNRPANVTELVLGKTALVLLCDVNDSVENIIDVSVTAADPENDVLTYNYTVTAGKIVGLGANIKWDLSGAAPGTYEITVGADDGCGICGKTVTKTVTIAKCY